MNTADDRHLTETYRQRLSSCRTYEWNMSCCSSRLQHDSSTADIRERNMVLLDHTVLLDHLHRRRSVHVAEHGVKGMSKVVGLSTKVLLRQRQQEGKSYQQEQEELEGQCHPEHTAPEQGPAAWYSLQIRREGTGSSFSVIPAYTSHTFTEEI